MTHSTKKLEQRRGGGDPQQQVEIALVIAGQDGPDFGRRVARGPGQVGTPLADDEEQGQETADTENPRRWGDADGGAAGQQAEDIAAGDDEQLDDRNMLQAERIADIGGQVDRRDQQEPAAKPAEGRDRHGRQHEQGEEQPGLGDGDDSRRDRPPALRRVAAVGRGVAQVVAMLLLRI